MKKTVLLILFSVLLASPVYAESALEMCTAEAKDAGIEDKEDFRAYVDECVEQVSAEMQERGESQGEENQEESAQESDDRG